MTLRDGSDITLDQLSFARDLVDLLTVWANTAEYMLWSLNRCDDGLYQVDVARRLTWHVQHCDPQ